MNLSHNTLATRITLVSLPAVLVVSLAVVAVLSMKPQTHVPTVLADAGADPALSHGTPVCGQPILNSPYNYTGATGPYRSGVAGLPTYGREGTAFPNATTGVVLPAQTRDYQNWELRPNTVYYLEPGTHTGSFEANTNDAFVGGYRNSQRTVMSGNYGGNAWAVDGYADSTGITVEYLTIEKYEPGIDHAALNQGGNTNFNIRYDTITLNAPGAGAFAATNSALEYDCMTQNGQYGFQSSVTLTPDSVTGGPYNITIENNEISYNDTCDLENPFNNKAIGWNNYNPVPDRYRNPHCGNETGDGNQGGFKLWQTDGVMIKHNWIHHNWGNGGWADTDNANTTWTENTITDNDGTAIDEEISYNFSITDNYMARNDILGGLNNTGFPSPAIYISESGSDIEFGGIPGCPEASCAGQGAYRFQSIIQHNTFVNNGGTVFLWQNSNRYCSSGIDGVCTLVKGGSKGPFSIPSCKANLPSSSFNTTTYAGNITGAPAEDWWDGCMWKTENVLVNHNEFNFNPAQVLDCNDTDWADCGHAGVFSEYGGPRNATPGFGGWAIPTDITFFQHNVWSDNVYNGPTTFDIWNQGSGDNPQGWAAWTGPIGHGDRCSSLPEKQSGYCKGPFGQDSGSTYNPEPAELQGSGVFRECPHLSYSRPWRRAHRPVDADAELGDPGSGRAAAPDGLSGRARPGRGQDHRAGRQGRAACASWPRRPDCVIWSPG